MKKLALPMLVAAAMTLVAASVAVAQQEKPEKPQTPKQYQECARKAGNDTQQQRICEEGLKLFQAGQQKQAEQTWQQVLKPVQK